jgi:dynein heavy chain
MATLLSEVNADYERTMNKIIFDKYLEETEAEEDDLYPFSLTLPPKEEAKET